MYEASELLNVKLNSVKMTLNGKYNFNNLSKSSNVEIIIMLLITAANTFQSKVDLIHVFVCMREDVLVLVLRRMGVKKIIWQRLHAF